MDDAKLREIAAREDSAAWYDFGVETDDDHRLAFALRLLSAVAADSQPVVAWMTIDGRITTDTSAPTRFGQHWSIPLYAAPHDQAYQDQIDALRKWQELAFRAHPNIDIDIENL
jgi:hypothetical protein